MNAAIDSKTMSEPAWIIKWRAREALKNGRPEEAHRLLDELIATGNRRAFALRDDVVRGYLDRAERALRHQDLEAAWADLARLKQLAPGDRQVRDLRDSLTRLALDEVRDELEAGHALQAVRAAARLKERPIASNDIGPLEEAAHEWVLAGEMADRGDFALAQASLERVRRRLGKRTAGLDRFEQELARRDDRFRSGWIELQEAVAATDWRSVLRTADLVLAVAPRHKEAQQARNRAWQAGQSDTVSFRPRDATPPDSKPTAEPVATVNAVPAAPIEEAPPPKRFILWIDGVGAWLVCLGSRISFGQAGPEGGPIDVPLMADVSRIHATLTRDEESYLLESNRDMEVNGRAASRSVLRSGDQLALAACAMTFVQPVPGCMSARLTLEGARRLPMAVDGVLLMADMLVLGPGDNVHVSMPELSQPLYLVRQKDRLAVSWKGEFIVEGQRCRDRAPLPVQGCVSSDAFTFAIEALGR
jgi:tetratricopeptide (TPR) repeat protein